MVGGFDFSLQATGRADTLSSGRGVSGSFSFIGRGLYQAGTFWPTVSRPGRVPGSVMNLFCENLGEHV